MRKGRAIDLRPKGRETVRNWSGAHNLFLFALCPSEATDEGDANGGARGVLAPPEGGVPRRFAPAFRSGGGRAFSFVRDSSRSERGRGRVLFPHLPLPPSSRGEKTLSSVPFGALAVFSFGNGERRDGTSAFLVA